MANIKFIDHTETVKAQMSQIAHAVLEECAGELESQVKRNTAVDTGQLKNSWTHRVTVDDTAGQYEAQVGSPSQNAIWEELGTGEYALNGDGRKGGWFYEDARGVGHFTHGKRPKRAFWNAYNALKNGLIKRIQNAFKGGLS